MPTTNNRRTDTGSTAQFWQRRTKRSMGYFSWASAACGGSSACTSSSFFRSATPTSPIITRTTPPTIIQCGYCIEENIFFAFKADGARRSHSSQSRARGAPSERARGLTETGRRPSCRRVETAPGPNHAQERSYELTRAGAGGAIHFRLAFFAGISPKPHPLAARVLNRRSEA